MTVITAALQLYPHTAPLFDGRVRLEGYELDFVDVASPTEPRSSDLPTVGLLRMLHGEGVDVCQMAWGTVMAAVEHSREFVVLPILPKRMLNPGQIYFNTRSGVQTPKDLEGKRVGIRALTATGSLWPSGILVEKYGVDFDAITWVVVEANTSKTFPYPHNVELAPGADLVSMLESNDVAASYHTRTSDRREIRPLLDSTDGEAWCREHGIYPINYAVAISRAVATRHPDLPGKLCEAYMRAKEPFLAEIQAGHVLRDEAGELAARVGIVGEDPFPYGIEANRRTFEASLRFGRYLQVLSDHHEVEELFYPAPES